MQKRLGRSITVAFILLAVAGCSVLAPAAGLKTAPAPPQACMEALTSGTLARNDQSGLGIVSSDGTVTPVEWPFGYSARNELGRLVLVDETGKAVAREGDEISMGGGFGTQFWHTCGPVSVTRPG